jgi:hypothetical protein
MPPKCSSSTRQSPKKKKVPKKAVSLPNLANIKDACLDEFGKSKNTKKAYKGYLSRGKKFLDEMVAQRRASGTDGDDINLNCS